MSNPAEDILTVRDVAKLLKMASGSIYNALSKNPSYVPHFKVGSRIRFSKRQVLAHFGIPLEGSDGKEVH